MTKTIFITVITAFILLMCIPVPKYLPDYSATLLDKNKELISAVVSRTEQWHLPLDEEIPEVLSEAIILYEDEYFYWHPGINPVSIIRSFYLNTKHKKIKRGGSTLTMQVMRMRNGRKSRNYRNKLYESIAAIKYSCFKSKKNILREWCEMAPFGGNTIGVKTAAFRYFRRSLSQLSNSEMALLAVMPNTPTSINLTVNRSLLLQRRNKLLAKMHQHNVISHDDYQLALKEDLPSYPYQVPAEAPHLLNTLMKKYPEKSLFESTIDRTIQNSIAQIINEESEYLQREDIKNMAAIVVDIEENEVVAYVGNSKQSNGKFTYVDVLQSKRSYGSLLKPLLYALALEDGSHLPKEFIYDTPVNYGEFRPENFDKKYRGIVPLDDIITQSLNVPAVRLLHELGINNFYDLLQKLKMEGINKGPDHYGLSVILGGGETTPWDLARIYTGMGRNYLDYANPYNPPRILKEETLSDQNSFSFSPFSITHTINAMANLSRPREDKSWQLFGYEHKVAWKTGTSYGHKDAWAAGINGKYHVLVWVGNEVGEGRKDLTGIVRAAPVMFKIFNTLPTKKWFYTRPYVNSKNSILVCDETGLLRGRLCSKMKSLKIANPSHGLKTCNYHTISPIGDTILKFHPVVEFYYHSFNPSFKSVSEENALKIIYPSDRMNIYLPKVELNKKNSFKAQCNYLQGKRLHWYLNKKFYGTSLQNEILISAEPGLYHLLVIDDDGNSDECTFQILDSQE